MHSLPRLTLASSFAVALAITGSAFAQTAAPIVPTMTPAPACENPGPPPSLNSSELGKAANEMKRNNWTKNMKTYMECLKTFVAEQQAASAPHVRAANTAIDELNRAINIFNEQINAAKQ
jgi:hypothetical protein